MATTMVYKLKRKSLQRTWKTVNFELTYWYQPWKVKIWPYKTIALNVFSAQSIAM